MRPVIIVILGLMAFFLLINADTVTAAKKAAVEQVKPPVSKPVEPQTPVVQPQAPAKQPEAAGAKPSPSDIVPSFPEYSEPVMAPTSPQSGEQINWQVVASGGGTQTLGTLILGSTIGQVAVGTSTVGSYTLQSGFWQNFAPSYLCGDLDHSGDIDIADAVYLINYIFSGGAAPNPMASGDTDCDGVISIADAVQLVNYIFAGGGVPCAACS
jgi:hypothetical protein